jgi:riboflavin kinase/FMN adenylyltransferase
MSAQAFAESILVNTLHAVEVHEGENFRFGRDAGTGVHGLEELGHLIGFKVCVYGPQKIRGQVISSSRVRQLIAEGHVEQARALLGRPFAIQGTPAPGRGYGSLYTVPTINFAPYADLLPANGVYITLLEIGAGAEARTFESVTNAGNRPTFGADPFTVETHILDFQPVTLSEITPLTLTFMKRLRGEHRFPTVADLREQIALDVQRARRYFHHYRWAVKHHPPAQQA